LAGEFALEHLRFPDLTQPLAEPEVGEIKEADGVNGEENQGGSDFAEVAEDHVVHYLPDNSTGAGGV
jgi:hypothetical protein